MIGAMRILSWPPVYIFEFNLFLPIKITTIYTEYNMCLCCRYNAYLKNYRTYHRNYEHQPDFTNPPSFLKEYETQVNGTECYNRTASISGLGCIKNIFKA